MAVDYYIEYKINKALQAEGIIKKFDDYIDSKVNKAIQGDAVIKKFDDYIDSKIRNALQSEEIIKKLQSNNRPFMIFDQNGVVVSDQGAWRLVEDLKVSLNKKGFVEKIIVTPKNPSAFPIITLLDNTVNHSINVERGKKLDVIFELEVRSYSEPRPTNSLFNLEMISGVALEYIPKISETKE